MKNQMVSTWRAQAVLQMRRQRGQLCRRSTCKWSTGVIRKSNMVCRQSRDDAPLSRMDDSSLSETLQLLRPNQHPPGLVVAIDVAKFARMIADSPQRMSPCRRPFFRRNGTPAPGTSAQPQRQTMQVHCPLVHHLTSPRRRLCPSGNGAPPPGTPENTRTI